MSNMSIEYESFLINHYVVNNIDNVVNLSYYMCIVYKYV